MSRDPIHVLHAASRAGPPAAARQRLMIAGATGTLGNEVVRRLAGSDRYMTTQVLGRAPVTTALRRVAVTVVPASDPAAWPPAAADVGVVMFDPPRLFYERERALWTPEPAQLPALAAWMRASGVRTLAVVLPHAQGRLPEALKRGLASLDEHAVATLGFERLLFIRTAQKPAQATGGGLAQRLARFMLSVFGYMVPSSEQPVRAARIAELLAVALDMAPPGIHVAAPELVWRAAQGDVRTVAREWLLA